ncbi:hypothetical protein M8818_003580 [Zalaria obscura]|uniref:Uncharacterized protein n=1 Tax=Zalaria obscura TaxID=2024903 RepID=A0ACC3SDP8_9PEZI
MDEGNNNPLAEAGCPPGSPPRKPNSSADAALKPNDVPATQDQTDAALVLKDEDWDIFSCSALSALKMLINALQALSNITGDIPPTPPVSRPTTPHDKANPSSEDSPPHAGDSPISPTSPDSPHSTVPHPLPAIPIGSPEAHRDEPILPAADIGANAEAITIQQAAISRRFYLKVAPPFSISDYLLRIHQYCPHSPGVYLAAAAYVHRLCVSETLVPATSRTIHRLALATIRIASKSLEDNKWPQDRIAKVGGVSKKELNRLEVNLCFLLGFELYVTELQLRRSMWLLQQAALQGLSMRKRLSNSFMMRLPARPKGGAVEV